MARHSHLTRPEADALGYVLTPDDVAAHMTVSGKRVRGWLRLAPSERAHLPSVMIVGSGLRSGAPAFRVHPDDVTALAARICEPCLPSDPLTPGEAVSVLAGRDLRRNPTAVGRYRERLAREAERGRLTRYVITDAPRLRADVRYSRAEVETLAHDGLPHRLERAAAMKARIERNRRDGEVTPAEAAKITGRAIQTVWRWAREDADRYGARWEAGQWFFDRSKLPAPQLPRQQAKGRVTREIVRCAVCGDEMERYRSETDRTRRRAEAAGRPVRFFCRGCLRTPEARELSGWRESLERRPKRHSEEARSRMSESQRKAWPDERREQQRSRAQVNLVPISQDPKRNNDRIEASHQARYGTPLGISWRQRRSDRSRAARRAEERLTELWSTDLTVEQIARELGTSANNVKQMRRRLALPARAPGRPTKK